MEEIIEEQPVLFAAPVHYVTYDEDGILTGSFCQEVQESHKDCYLEVTPEQRSTWVMFQMSEDRTSLVPYKPAVDLEALKESVNVAINAWRLKANQTSFNFDGKEISCDPVSRSDLDGTANYIGLMGEFEPGFPGKWKCVDNTYIPMLEIEDFKEMYAAMVATGSANFMKAQQMKAKLAAAMTEAEVATVREELL